MRIPSRAHTSVLFFGLMACCLALSGCRPRAAPVQSRPQPKHSGPTIDQVCKIAAELLGVEASKVTAGTSLGDLKADELDFVELIMELEDHFDVVIPDEAAERMMGTANWQAGMHKVTMAGLAAMIDQQRRSQPKGRGPLTASPDARKAVRDVELEELIDALANRINRAPKIIDRGQMSEPLFDEDYDAEEQRRVKQALRTLNEQAGNELWPHLVANLDDQRYALTFVGDYRAQNETVGSLCRKMAERDLLLPYLQYAPSVDKRVGLEYPNYRFNEWTPSLTSAYARRQEKQLSALPIEMCEWAMTEAPALAELSPEQKQKFVEQVSKEITKLKETRQPVVETSRFHGDFHATFSAEQARRLRERLLKDSENK
jgi:acyl carrier protein